MRKSREAVSVRVDAEDYKYPKLKADRRVTWKQD